MFFPTWIAFLVDLLELVKHVVNMGCVTLDELLHWVDQNLVFSVARTRKITTFILEI